MTSVTMAVPSPPLTNLMGHRTAADGRDPLPQDDVLIERLLSGDEAAFSALVEAYSSAMLRLAAAFVSSRAVAEEVLQETWIAVLKGLGRFEQRSSLRTWVFRILSNRAKTRGVREGRTIPFTALGEAPETALEPGCFTFDGRWQEPPNRWDADTPERMALRREVREVVESAVAQLPDKQRSVMTLRDLELVGSRETCNILGITETYQRVLLHRARVKVRESLATYLSGDGDELPGGKRESQ